MKQRYMEGISLNSKRHFIAQRVLFLLVLISQVTICGGYGQSLFQDVGVQGVTLESRLADVRQSVEVKLTEVLRIGDDEDAGAEYLFGHASHVVTDQAANIYIADERAFEIKVYDKTGIYLRSIGGQGQGPGEFQHFTGMTITDDDVLVVGDVFNARMTRLSTAGDVIGTHRLDYDVLMYPRWMQQRADGTFLVGTRPPRRRPDTDKLFHIYTDDFQEKRAAFGATDLLGDHSDRGYEYLSGSFVGSIWLEGNQLLYAPKYYQGKIHVLTQGTDESVWEVTGALSGHVNQTKAITVVLEGEGPLEFPHVMATTSSRGDRYGKIFHNESLGMWRLQNGDLVHFTIIQDGDKRVFGVEIYDENNQFLGYGELEHLKGFGPKKLAPAGARPMWKDKNDVFYFVNMVNMVAYILEYTQPNK